MGALTRQRVAMDSLSRTETQFRATYNAKASPDQVMVPVGVAPGPVTLAVQSTR